MGGNALKTYTRSEAASVLEALIAEFEEDHEGHTGITGTAKMPLINWWSEILNVIENTS